MPKTKKDFKVGDTVTTFLKKSSGDKIAVKGLIKSIKHQWGNKTYVIEQGVVDNFPTRTVK